MRVSTSGDAGKVSLRSAIEAVRRLDELGTARWIEAAAEVVHKTQSQGHALGTLIPEALVMRDGDVVLELPASGALAYTAPERLRGGAGDRRSDVWSLGVMLWEALAHVRLFEGTSDEALQKAIETTEIVPVNEMNANVPAELGAICTKALQRDPAGRYQSAKVMAAEISAVLDDAGYPEGTEAITKWIGKEFAAAPAAPAPAPPVVPAAPIAAVPAPVPATGSKPLNQTMMGMAPFGEVKPPVLPKPASAKPTVVDNKTEPLTALDIIEHRPQTAQAVIPLDNPIIPLVEKKPAAPAPEPATPADPPRAKSESKSSLPAWATRPGASQPPPSATPAQPIVPSVPFSPSTTLQGISNPAIKPPPIEAAPAAAMKLPDAPPGATISADKPSAFNTTSIVGSSLSSAAPAAPPPAAFAGNRTATMGSNAIIEAVNASVSAANPPPASPAVTPPVTPAPSAAAAPAVAVVAPVAPVAAPVVPSIALAPTPVAPVKISEAETVNTPAITIPRTPTPQPDIRAVNWDEHAAKAKAAAAAAAAATPATAVEPGAASSPNTAVSKLPPPADDDFTDKEPSSSHASPTTSAGVSAARTGNKRAITRGDRTGKADVLAGWGWGTDSHEALVGEHEEDSYEADRQKAKKRLFLAIGGAIGVVVLIVVIAFAASGGKPSEDDQVAKSTTPVGDPTQAGGGVEAPKVVPEPAPEPAPPPAQGSNTEPAAGSSTDANGSGSNAATEPPKPEPAVTKPEPEPKPEPKVEPKPEPKKPDPVVVKKPEPKKPDPVVVKKPEPKKPPVVVAKKPDPKPEPKPAKVDAATAYKAGFQLYVKGDTSGALASFKEALASNPGYAPTWRGIGLVYEKLGRKSQAVTAFKRYLELSPGAGDAEQIRNRLERLGS